jgi:adenylyltransferase/sulfurtransferase
VGVGFLRLVDHDTISISNVLRQNLYTIADVGLPKAEIALNRAKELNPFIRIEGVSNVFEPSVLDGVDLVIDATDNLDARLAIAAAARLAGIPLVHGAAIGLEGRVAVFWPKGSPCPGCLFSEDAACGTCEEDGVLSTVTAVIGSLMAHEAIKTLTGVGDPLAGLLVFDSAATTFTEFEVTAHPGCRLCGQGTTPPSPVPVVTVECLAQKLRTREPILLLDVREEHELEISRLEPCLHVPMAQVVWRSRDFPKDAEILVLCRTGNRSGTVTRALMLRGFTNVYNVAGGINAYAERIDPSLTVY